MCQLVLLTALALSVGIRMANSEMSKKDKMKELVKISSDLTKTLQTYDKRLRPNAGGDPEEVVAEFRVVSLGEINEAKMEYSMDIFFRQWWTDFRLKSNFTQALTMAIDASSIIWMPDTYFQNAKKTQFHKGIGDCMRLIIWPNGTIYYSVRITLTLSCEMDLRLYPLDTQHCPFIVESHAYTQDKITYRWAVRGAHGIEVTANETAQFILIEARAEHISVSKMAGTYSSLFGTFSFKRRIEFFVITVFAPATILTLMSWCSLWISPEAIPARISLCITTILSIIFLSSGVNSHMPKVSYMKAIDFYLLGNFCFIFLALVEYVVVLNTRPRPTKLKRDPHSYETRAEAAKAKARTTTVCHDVTSGNQSSPLSYLESQNKHTEAAPTFYEQYNSQTLASGFQPSNDRRPSSTSQDCGLQKNINFIDRVSRVLFPAVYAVFLVSFSFYYFLQNQPGLIRRHTA